MRLKSYKTAYIGYSCFQLLKIVRAHPILWIRRLEADPARFPTAKIKFNNQIRKNEKSYLNSHLELFDLLAESLIIFFKIIKFFYHYWQ